VEVKVKLKIAVNEMIGDELCMRHRDMFRIWCQKKLITELENNCVIHDTVQNVIRAKQ